jgi:hypothetical protein
MEFQALTPRIDREIDPAKRLPLVHQAEAVMEQDPPLLPVAWERINDLVQLRQGSQPGRLFRHLRQSCAWIRSGSTRREPRRIDGYTCGLGDVLPDAPDDEPSRHGAGEWCSNRLHHRPGKLGITAVQSRTSLWAMWEPDQIQYRVASAPSGHRARQPIPEALPRMRAVKEAFLREEVRFALDSPLEGAGFEPSVPPVAKG